MSNLSIISENIKNVLKQIENAAAKDGRKSDDIKLVAVSKTVGVNEIIEAAKEDVIDFGENRVQDFLKKYDILGESYNWHFIGRLQTNKVKYIVDKVKLIHSLDRLDLALEIQKRAEQIDKVVDVLVQVNVSGEESKTGIAPENLENFIKEVSSFGNIKIQGLMTMAPYTCNPEDVRWVFRETRKIFIDMAAKKFNNMDMRYLSMGMSGDFKVAVEEGANMVRIGSAIFGNRF